VSLSGQREAKRNEGSEAAMGVAASGDFAQAGRRSRYPVKHI
jgi:hypothetical protein